MIFTNFETISIQKSYLNCQRHSTVSIAIQYSFFDLFLFTLFLLLLSISPSTASLFNKNNTNRFTEEEINLLRKSFLNKFGMKEEPKQSMPVLPVPNYVWGIYERVKGDEVEWVRHYYPKQITESDDRTLLLQYDLSVSVQNLTNERVVRADLKLKLTSSPKRRQVKVYEIDQQNTHVWRLIDARFIDKELNKNEQWIEMDVVEALKRKRPDMNKVELAVELSDGHLLMLPTTSQSTIASIPYSRKQAAALVVYVQTVENNSRIRKKRKAGSKRRHQHKKHNHRPAERHLCQRQELLVDFNELNWQDWILAPSSYSAYQCRGECPNPLSSHFNTTNHAIVQGLINSVDPSLVPAPCCVPTEMESLAILYIDVESKIVIKNYPDMEVLSCGCR